MRVPAPVRKTFSRLNRRKSHSMPSEAVVEQQHVDELQPRASSSSSSSPSQSQASAKPVSPNSTRSSRSPTSARVAPRTTPESVPKAEAGGPAVGEETAGLGVRLVHGKTVLQVVALVALLWAMLVVKLFQPYVGETVVFGVCGMVAGLVLSYQFQANRCAKVEAGHVLNLEPGFKGSTLLFGEPHTWVSYRHMDNAEWLNKILSELWPFYDKAICDSIKDTIEPVMESARPPVFKNIGFKKITFGEVPFRIEGVCVDEYDGEIIVDFDIRWCGDSNITLSIEPNLPGDMVRLTPAIDEIALIGTLRLTLKPLLNKLPCIGAVTVSLLKPPLLNFRIDVGKALGGNTIGNTVKQALRRFIKDTLVDILIWPNRSVVPIMYPEDTGPLDDLELHSVGLLTVEVVQAFDLPAADMGGTSDPIVEVFTDTTFKYKTKVVKANLNPVWSDEIEYFFVQEPRTQSLKINVYDIDIINARNLMKSFNVLKSIKEMVGAEELLGRTQIPIQPLMANPGVELDDVFDLGMGEWSSVGGTGSGCGQLRLKLTYKPFSMLNPAGSEHGALILRILRCRNLVPKDSSGTSDPYVRAKVKSKAEQTHVVPQNLNPDFFVTYSWRHVTTDDRLKLKVYDRDYGPQCDDFLGQLHIPIGDVAKSIDAQGNAGVWKDWFVLDDIEHGDIELMLRFVPFD